MENLQDLKRNENKISEAFTDENGNLIREVDGQKIIQIEEDSEEKARLNHNINLWRMRRK